MIHYKRITIEWSYPIEINNILQKDCMNEIGIYYISRKFGEKQSILYIEKTTYHFKSRLISHKEEWLDCYRGKKFVRLGRIVYPKNCSEEELKALINDAERTIIFYLSNKNEHKLIANIASTKSTAFDYVLKITNIGYRGDLPPELYLSEDMLVHE